MLLRLRLLLLLCVFFVSAGCVAPAAKRVDLACADCNVIFISIDTLRADHLGCYGYDRPTSPNVDRFSTQSVLFRNSIAHAPSTEPSHASMFTSLIPAHHGGLRALHQPISEDVRTMAEILKEAGFATVSFNGGGQVSASYGFDRGFDLYKSGSGKFAQKVGQAIRWMLEHEDDRFFMFLHSYEVHAPYEPDPKHMELFDADYTGELDDTISTSLLIDIQDGIRSVDDEDVQHIINAYDAEIRSMDVGFGRLLQYLRNSGLDDKTLIVFTSDHGEEFGEHGSVGRHSHTLYDELLRVPLIVRLPGDKLASTVIEEQVRGIDILPSVMELLGMPPLDQFAGASFVGMLQGDEAGERPAISQIDTADPVPPTSFRTDSRKLIVGAERFVGDDAYRWYEQHAEFVARTHSLDLPIEAFHTPRRMKILVDGEPWAKEPTIGTSKQLLHVPFSTPEERRVRIESQGPCTPAAEVGAEIGVPCASFRVFNPFEYYLLGPDPGEQNNLYYDPRRRAEVEAIQKRVGEMLSSRAAPDGSAVEVDAETQERLRALGYVD